MEKPETITERPVRLDLTREHCEQIYNEWRESRVTYIELMMMAYAKGKVLGRAEAFDEVWANTRPTTPTKPADDDDKSIMELAREMKRACDHFDAIAEDRRALAREVNGQNRVARFRR